MDPKIPLQLRFSKNPIESKKGGGGQGRTSMTRSLKESIDKSLSVVITELRLL